MGRGQKWAKFHPTHPGLGDGVAREFSDKRGHSVRNYAATSAKKSTPSLMLSGKPASRSLERYLPFFIEPLDDARAVLRDAFRAVVSYAVLDYAAGHARSRYLCDKYVKV